MLMAKLINRNTNNNKTKQDNNKNWYSYKKFKVKHLIKSKK